MATQVKHRRGTSAEIAAKTPAVGELWFNTTDNTIHMGDGVTQGGIKQSNIVNARNYGAKGDGSTDDWTAINTALQTYKPVYLDSGTFAVSQTVFLRQNQHLILGPNVTLVMPLSLTASLEPTVWVGAPFASVVGMGQRSSYIKKESKSPDGVVKLGQANMATSSNAVFNCKLSNFEIVGQQAYGQTSGEPDIGLHMPSPELNGHFNYFHDIDNIGVRDVNIGFWLRGYANGLFMSKLYGLNIGNTSIQSAMILHQGALDNMMTDIFFNQSNDVPCVIVEDLDNTANGSLTPMRSQYNTYRGVVSEQGGSTEVAFDIRTSRNSFFEVRDNVSIGNLLFSGFQADNNTFFSSRTVILPLDTSANRLEATSRLNVQRTTVGDSSQEGMTFGEGFTNSVTADNDIVTLYNRINGGGRILDFRIGGSNVGQVHSTGAGILSLTSANYGLQFRDTFVAPCDTSGNLVSSQLDLGVASARYGTGFFVNSPDVSSDRNLKTDEQEVPQWLKNACMEIKGNIKLWRWLHKVEMQDEPTEGDNARLHSGVMAQDVMDTLERHAPEDFDIFSLSMISSYEYEVVNEDNEVTSTETRYSIKPIEIMWVILSAI